MARREARPRQTPSRLPRRKAPPGPDAAPTARAATGGDAGSDLSPDGRPVLDATFPPRSVAVIGATGWPASIGRTLMKSLETAPKRGRALLTESESEHRLPSSRAEAAGTAAELGVPDAVTLHSETVTHKTAILHPLTLVTRRRT